MRINLITIGKKMPEWINTGINHYKKQLPSSYNFTLTALEAQNRKAKNIDQIKSLESKMLLEAASGASILIAFDETGRQQSSQTIANTMKNWQLEGENVALLIGGADGLTQECKAKCHQLWGLSKLTMTHSMARLLVVEQIYRGHSLLTNHPYHRE
ncbi:MAG TPA: 23S rRNA (pseudouridine(1915)-N(3))-methyltransferase RlmH [Candidatus Thioglobus sp.]|nr:23S rRNA (pseudouridine(1915)-N(3))-methyltransferase RlmH [Candidatus Thioglobus sp.]HIL21612.1 23S rRNA (pseudouridine(1915)-N(3))-methyltransferase RlmH [Candidatus Thioglobus sp.]